MLWLLLLVGCSGLNRRDPSDPSLRTGGTGQSYAVCHDEGSRVRLVTYNVHGESAGSLIRALRSDPELRAADVFLLQEVEHHGADVEPGSAVGKTTDEIAATLGMSYAFAPGYGLSDGGSHGVAILSRCPLSDVEIIELPRNHVHVNSNRKAALAATVELAGRSVRVYSVHLDNRINPGLRRRQLTPVLRHARSAVGSPVIIGGDFNTSPFCWLFHVVPVPCWLQGRRLERHVRRARFATPVTESGGTMKWLAMRLDGFYTRAVQVENFGVADDTRVSDHLPLWMDIRLSGKGTLRE